MDSGGTKTTPIEQQITYALNNGRSMPGVGLGTWRSEPGQMKEIIRYALEEANYRHIDAAKAYGNEESIGEALEEVFKKGKIKREDVWITTKLWIKDAGPKHVEAALVESLRKLRLDYVDLYLVHWPVVTNPNQRSPPKPEDFSPVELESTWHEMEKLEADGRAKAIGVSNYSVKKMETILKSALMKPAVNQVEVHPGWRNDKIIKFCHEKGIHVTAYSPLGSQDSKFKDEASSSESSLLDHSVIRNVAKKLGKSAGQVMLKWNLQRGLSVVPKSTNPKRILDNIDLFGWELSSEDMEALSHLEPQQKVVSDMFCGVEGAPYKTKEELWDGEI